MPNAWQIKHIFLIKSLNICLEKTISNASTDTLMVFRKIKRSVVFKIEPHIGLYAYLQNKIK